MNIFSKNNSDNEIVKEFKNRTEDVEKKMVKIACNIIDGCFSLLDFIPDFFSTISLLLLDKEIILSQSEEDKGVGNNMESEKRGETDGEVENEEKKETEGNVENDG